MAKLPDVSAAWLLGSHRLNVSRGNDHLTPLTSDLAQTGPLKSELLIFIASDPRWNMTCSSQCVPEFCRPRWCGAKDCFLSPFSPWPHHHILISLISLWWTCSSVLVAVRPLYYLTITHRWEYTVPAQFFPVQLKQERGKGCSLDGSCSPGLFLIHIPAAGSSGAVWTAEQTEGSQGRCELYFSILWGTEWGTWGSYSPSRGSGEEEEYPPASRKRN